LVHKRNEMNEIQFKPAKPIVVIRLPWGAGEELERIDKYAAEKMPDYHVALILAKIDEAEFHIVSIKEATPEMISEIKEAIERMERLKK
jgi:hypothetical protein